MNISSNRRKTGRNDPCPCGSGKKYKQCCLQQQVAAPPRESPDAKWRQARELMDAGRWEAALPVLRALCRTRPRDVKVMQGLARCLCAGGRFSEAGKVLEKAAASIPARVSNRAWLLADIAMALLNARQSRAALRVAEQALSADPLHPRMHYVMGLCLERGNRHGEALRSLEQAHRLDPGQDFVAIALARLHGREGDPEAGIRILEKVIPGARDDETAGNAWREKALLLDRLGRYDAAFEAASNAGGRLLRSPAFARFDHGSLARMVAANRQGHATARGAVGHEDGDIPPPVFLMGFLRSGTTLLEQVLAAHPAVVTVDESLALYHTRRELDRIVPGRASLPEKAAALAPDQRFHLRRFYRRRLTVDLDKTASQRVVVDKNALNTIDIALVDRLFPDARIVFALRDPRDVCISCFLQSFAPSDMTVHLLAWDSGIEMYRQLMGLWLAVRDGLHAGFLEVRYEDMVSAFEPSVRNVLGFLELDWHPSVNDYHKRAASRYISTPSFADVARPVHGGAVGRWRHYARWFSGKEKTLHRFLEAFGYDHSWNAPMP